MQDTCFLQFTEDSMIEKIDIDSRLHASFKRVMRKIQEIFNVNHYTEDRNYKEYLEKYFLHSGEKNMRIYINKLEPVNLGGFYNRNRNEICINEDRLSRGTDMLDATLFHEFIHFLVMHGLVKGACDPDIYNGGFINEALTEMLTQQAYPKNNAYEAQVSMQKYANQLSGNTNNFRRFLQGFVDARYSSPAWQNYRECTYKFQKDFRECGYITLAHAQINENYLQAQRQLINLFIRPYSRKNIEEYIDSISKLMDRPASDTDGINEVVRILDETFLSNMRIKNATLKEFLQTKLNELKSEIARLKYYGGKSLYEFEFENRKLAVDEEHRVYGNTVGVVRTFDPNTGIMEFHLDGKKLILNLNEIDFSLKEKECIQKTDELSTYFMSESRKDLDMIREAAKEKGTLTKIEKFTIPILETQSKKKSNTVYIATYEDRAVILSGASEIGLIENIMWNRYIGMSSSDPKTAAIYAEELGMIEKGIVYSMLSPKFIERKVTTLYANQINDTLSEEEINLIIEQYKNSEEYIEDIAENVREDALIMLSEKKINSLPSEDRKKLWEKVVNQNPRFVLSTKDGKVDVSYIFGEKFISAYKGNAEVLYSEQGIGMYNEVFDSVYKKVEPEKESDKLSIPIDKEGNIQFSTSEKEENQMNTHNAELKNEEYRNMAITARKAPFTSSVDSSFSSHMGIGYLSKKDTVPDTIDDAPLTDKKTFEELFIEKYDLENDWEYIRRQQELQEAMRQENEHIERGHRRL